MSNPDNGAHIQALGQEVYDAQQAAHRLERRLAEAGEHDDPAALAEQLVAAQARVTEAEQALAAARKRLDSTQVVEQGSETTRTRGLATTGLQIIVEPQMANVPTAIYHLLSPDEHPLVKCTLTTNASIKRVRITSYIEGYSAKAISTLEVKRGQATPTAVLQQPTLFPDKIQDIHEVTRASLNILGEDLETGKIEVHETQPFWLLARTTVPLATYDPASGVWKDMSRYLGAFVTPNHPEVMGFLYNVASRHPEARILGYQNNADVESQVRAVFDALKEAGIVYVNSVRDFNPDAGVKSQRLRLPAQSLRSKQANCVDGAVLFASLLEAMSLDPALVVLPGHVIIGWESAPGSNQWQYLDTTKLDKSFEQAIKFGSVLAASMEKQATATSNEAWFRRWPLRDLRGKLGIYPAE